MNRSSRGFTIVETLLFLAVSSLLVLIVTVGRGVSVRRTQFTDTLESLQSFLIQLQREQFSTANPGSPSITGQHDPDVIQFMTVVRFTPGSSDVTIERCTTDRENGPRTSAGAYTNYSCAAYDTYRLKWDAVYTCLAMSADNCSSTVVFYIHHLSGETRSDGINQILSPSDITTILTNGYENSSARMTEIGITSNDGSLRGAIVLNDTGSPAGLGLSSNRLNQIGRVFR
jgi:type II secretory pathway pseudopilin PulG